MPFSDQLVTCETCGKQFVYRVEEQRRQAEMGFELVAPTECPKCGQPADDAPGLRAGVVKWYREDKHFGFITQQAGADVFFHRSGVEGDIAGYEEGTNVWYEVQSTERGLQAINVHLRD